MGTLMPVLGLFTAAIAIYLALALTVRTIRSARPPAVFTQRNSHAWQATLAHPIADAVRCVQDSNEQDWTWPLYTVVLLLLALICVVVMALLTLVVYAATVL